MSDIAPVTLDELRAYTQSRGLDLLDMELQHRLDTIMPQPVPDRRRVLLGYLTSDELRLVGYA